MRSSARLARGLVLALGTAGLPSLRRRLLRLGATETEARGPLPGDDLVPLPLVDSTLAIDIDAPASAVWPWLVQMGCGRAGWYGIDLLDNGGRRSAERVHPEWQALEPGDRIAMTPRGRASFVVEQVDTGRALVLSWAGSAAGFAVASSWTLWLEERDGATRLLARARAGGAPRLPFRALSLLVGEPGHVLVQRRQLVNLRRRAERVSASLDERGYPHLVVGAETEKQTGWFTVS